MTYQEYVGGRMKYGVGQGSRYNNVRTPGSSRTVSPQEAASRRAAQAEAIRRRETAEAASRRREAELRRRYEAEARRMKAYEARLKRERKEAKRAEAEEMKRIRMAEEAALLRREIKVERKRLSVSFVVIMLTVFVLLMGVVFSYAQMAETGAELSDINDRLAEIEEESAKLEIALEHKNDVTIIEDRAVNELLMVREDSVQKKYVTISSGDKIVFDTASDGETVTNGFFGSVLSSFSSAFDDILDYFR